ncbi:hypothetical protein HPP92_006714 [Vanilla planifolia]|uniref:Uncharacterized protein n=1 Tax=Vanilla planifolia TaxID=51239 RepID=A0A835RCI9_VANPL|nr:hypothetical protein HPP92_006714 [Vanilla planifolia]
MENILISHRQNRPLKVEDLVLRKCEVSKRQKRFDKLALNWDMSYLVKEIVESNAYKFQIENNTEFPWTSGDHLKNFYFLKVNVTKGISYKVLGSHFRRPLLPPKC